MLTFSNLRKSKGQTFGLITLMLMAAMFINIGLVIFFNAGSFFSQRAEELNSAHFFTMQKHDAPSNAQLYFLEQFEGVSEVESQGVLAGIGRLSDQALGLIVIDYGTSYRSMNPMTTLGDVLPLTNDAVYLPRILYLNSGYNIGDLISFDFMGETLEFTLAGSTEEVIYDGLMQVWRIFVPHERFLELYANFEENRVNILSVRLENSADTGLLSTEYNRRFFGTEYGFTGAMSRLNIYLPMTYDTLFMGRLTMPIMVATLIAMFAMILLFVGITIIRFQITSSIEENKTNIGILKAIGYLSYQIILAVVMQFGMIVLVGATTGIALAQVSIPILIQIIEPMFGLVWSPSIDIRMMVISLGFILILTLGFSLMTAWRINHLNALSILRGTAGNHQFKKSLLPLHSAKSPLVLLLALRGLFQNKKQSIMICLIVAGLTIASTAGIATHYNMSVNMENFVRMIGGELANVDLIITLNDSEHAANFNERLSANPEVARMYGLQDVGVLIDDVPVFIEVVETFEYWEGFAILDGRFPIHDNEIMLTHVSLNAMGKGLGDWVEVVSGEKSHMFLVTGIVQDPNYGGFTGRISVEGIKRIQPHFIFSSFHIVLADYVDEALFTKTLLETDSNIIFNIASIQNEVDMQVASLGDIFSMVVVIILLVVAIMVVLVLYMTIKIMLLRRKRELGIQKAVGFTTLQLMNQIALNLTPIIFVGTAIGASIGYFSFNPLFVLLLGGMGITQANMSVPITWIVVMCVAIVVLAYAVSMLIAVKIRKISAYILVSQ